MIWSLAQPSLYCFSQFSSSKTLTNQTHTFLINTPNPLSRFGSLKSKPRFGPTCFFNAGKDSKPPNIQANETKLDWPVLKRWDVPWGWQTASLTSLACGLSFVLTGLVETAAIPYLGVKIEELSLDEKAEILFLDQGITTAVVIAVLYGISNSFKPLPEDFFQYDLREPFNLQKGWLLWAGIGLGGAILAIALTGAAMSLFNGENPPQRETDALVQLLPLIGSSSIRVPTPIAVIISAAVFAFAHLTPGEFPQLFVLETKGTSSISVGTALGFSYAQTRNLLTPITIHAFWNSGVILLLTFLQLQGYDLKELLQAAS
ncbi:uncharacterized protein LOC123215449 isoform X3 [Mangifera indica]|uniref:uncharacterized protein LOC123215449 isoform X3 n=1 Tax=Mangifera indica TaxID=29780 RepID=UPI001CFBC75A|nr:uncharacterized protein LOC123215449 isoform X3 [Mangifera indica]